MFERLGRFVVRRPWWVIAAWVVAAVAILSTAPTLSEVTNQDQTEFLPSSYESIEAQDLAEETFGTQADATATIVFKRTDGEPLTESDQATVGEVADELLAADIANGSIAPGLIAWAAQAFDLQVDPSLQTILLVVLYGIGTDYILFLMFRYRERLRVGDDKKQAMVFSVARVGEVIASAAGVVIVAFLALLLATLGFFTSLGPALAIAVALMLVAALTLVPAIVSLLGTRVFWPSKSWQRQPKGTIFQRLGGLVGRRPGLTALVSGGVLVVLAAGTLGLRVNFDQTGQLPDDTESAVAFEDLQTGFPAGAINPTSVYLRSIDGPPSTRPRPRISPTGSARSTASDSRAGWRGRVDGRARRRRHGRPDQPAPRQRPLLQQGSRPRW